MKDLLAGLILAISVPAFAQAKSEELSGWVWVSHIPCFIAPCPESVSLYVEGREIWLTGDLTRSIKSFDRFKVTVAGNLSADGKTFAVSTFTPPPDPVPAVTGTDVDRKASTRPKASTRSGTSRPTFGIGNFAPSVVEGKPLNPVFRYPEGTRKLFAVFDYAGMTPQTRWGWRLSREGALLDEARDLGWKKPGAGTFVLPLNVPGDAGIYDLDLFLNYKTHRIPSFIVGEPVPQKDRLHQADDFEAHKSYWGSADRTEGGAARFKNENGRAAITLLQGEGPAWKTSGQSFGDVIVEVDVTPLGEPGRNAYGVVFRYQDDQNFYAFLINPQGEFAILRVKDGEQLWEKEWTRETPDIILRGKNTNRVRVLVHGEIFRFYVNGRVVGGLAEALWRVKTGMVGILVLGRGKPGVQVGFDNWRVWSLPGEYELAPDKAPWAGFDFVKPGVTRAEVDKRLGKPYVSSISVVVQGQIDLFLDEVPTKPSNPQRAPQPTEDVHYYDYRPDKFPSKYARIVFRKGQVWYAMLPAHGGEKTREEIIARYGDVFEEEKVHGQSGHVLWVHVILWLKKKGLAFVEEPGRGITHRVVFPAEP